MEDDLFGIRILLDITRCHGRRLYYFNEFYDLDGSFVILFKKNFKKLKVVRLFKFKNFKFGFALP